MLKILEEIFQKDNTDYCVDWDRLEIVERKVLERRER